MFVYVSVFAYVFVFVHVSLFIYVSVFAHVSLFVYVSVFVYVFVSRGWCPQLVPQHLHFQASSSSPICIPTQGGRNPNTAPNTPHQIPNTPPYPPWITNTSFIPTNYTTQDKKNGILNPKRYSKYSNLVTPCYIWFLQSGCLMLYLYFQANKKYIAGKSGSRLYAGTARVPEGILREILMPTNPIYEGKSPYLWTPPPPPPLSSQMFCELWVVGALGEILGGTYWKLSPAWASILVSFSATIVLRHVMSAWLKLQVNIIIMNFTFQNCFWSHQALILVCTFLSLALHNVWNELLSTFFTGVTFIWATSYEMPFFLQWFKNCIFDRKIA